MELRQLEYFAAVARLGGFSRAAAQLRVAQPAVSAQIQRLERELGTALFTRTTRRVTLTHAGTLLLARAQTVLAELDAVRTDFSQLAAVTQGHLRLGVTPVLGPLDFPGLLASFHRRYPGVSLAVTSDLVPGLTAQLDAGDLDALIAPVHGDLAGRYSVEPLAPEAVRLATPPGRLPRRSTPARLAAVRDDPFVCLAPGSGLHAILLDAAAQQRFTPRIGFQAPDPAGIRSFVAAGLGVALLAASAAGGDGPAIDVHRLTPDPPHPPIGLIRRPGEPAAALAAWLDHVRRHSPAGLASLASPAAPSTVSP